MNSTSEVNEAITTIRVPQECLELVRDLVHEHGSQLYFFKHARWLDLDPQVVSEFAGEDNIYKPFRDNIEITESGNVCPLGGEARCLTTERRPLREGDKAGRPKTIGLITDNLSSAKNSGTTLTRDHFLGYELQDCETGSCELYPGWEYQLSRSKNPDGDSALSLLGEGTESVLLLRVPVRDDRGDSEDIWTTVTSIQPLQSAIASKPHASHRTGWGWDGFTDVAIGHEDLLSRGRYHLRHVRDGDLIKVILHSDMNSDQHEFSAIEIHPGWTQASA